MSYEFDWQNAMIDLTAERDRLKAELDSIQTERANQVAAILDHRDAWKRKAEKLAKALREIKCLEQHLDNSQPPQICPVCIIDKALAEFREGK